MKTACFALLLAACVLPTLAGDDDAQVLEIYDIRDLAEAGLSEADLAGRLRERLEEGECRFKGEGTLIVRGTRDTQSRIKALLAELRRSRSLAVTLEGRFVRFGDGERAALGRLEFFDGKTMEDLLASWRTSEGVTIISAPRLTCYDSQRASISVGEEVSCVLDAEVEDVDGVRIVDPVVSNVFAGVRLEMRPVVSADRKCVTIVIDSRTTAVLTGEAAPDRPGIRTDEIRETRLRRSVTIPDGTGVLIGLGEDPQDGGRVALLLNARLVDLSGEEDRAPEIDLVPEEK